MCRHSKDYIKKYIDVNIEIGVTIQIQYYEFSLYHLS